MQQISAAPLSFGTVYQSNMITETKRRKKILVVDDERNVRESLQALLGNFYEVCTAECGHSAADVLDKFSLEKTETEDAVHGGHEIDKMSSLDLIILDLLIPGIDGLNLLGKIKADYPQLPVIMVSASTAVKSAVQAMKIGAIDYLSKPFDADELLLLIEDVINQPHPRIAFSESTAPTHPHRTNLPDLSGDFGCLVGQNALMLDLYQKIEQVAVRETTVLITGESGTGKELVAREIHRRSTRVKGPFVALNCAAIPESLIESELFGHEKGAFTHAVERRIGQFEQANHGTLFLDEIGELSLSVQVKMLRFLQEQEFYRVGRSKPVRVDVRVIAATNKSLETAIKAGLFRQDLYYRINVVALEIAPLRERIEDIPRLVEFFIGRLSQLYGDRKIFFGEAALEILKKYSWPGNVRELENITESLLALAPQGEVREVDLPARMQRLKSETDIKQNVIDGHVQFEEAARAFETEIILSALRKTNFVQTQAAELLGISRRILKYKMDKLGILSSDT